MKRNKPGVMPEITREVYKGVKKFDRQQFSDFCRDLYTYGYTDGRASVPHVDVEKICEVIAATKGVGVKKVAEIRANLSAAFGGSDKTPPDAQKGAQEPPDALSRANTQPEAQKRPESQNNAKESTTQKKEVRL